MGVVSVKEAIRGGDHQHLRRAEGIFAYLVPEKKKGNRALNHYKNSRKRNWGLREVTQRAGGRENGKKTSVGISPVVCERKKKHHPPISALAGAEDGQFRLGKDEEEKKARSFSAEKKKKK